jgi:prevent-host-death family protein
MKATTKDLRLHSAELLAATDRGESVVVTYRGKRRAVLQRWDAAANNQPSASRNPAFGMWAEGTDDVEAYVRTLRQRRPLP